MESVLLGRLDVSEFFLRPEIQTGTLPRAEVFIPVNPRPNTEHPSF